MSDFIYRAKLEADALLRYDYLSPRARAESVDDFMAGVDAVLALLDAETTEEWGVALPKTPGAGAWPTTDRSRAVANAKLVGVDQIVSRRVLYGPWLPSEGGEKP